MPDDVATGVRCLEEALELDPNYAAAHAHLAWAFEMRYYCGGFNEADAAASLRHARAAVAHGGDEANALSVAALPLLQLGHDFEAASGAIARALAVNGSSAAALYFGAHIHAYSGEAALVEDYAQRALRLGPFDVLAFEGHCALGLVRIREQRFVEAAALLAKAVQANPRFSVLWVEHAAALALAGRIDDAKAVGKRVLELEPNFRAGAWENGVRKFMPARALAPADGRRTPGGPAGIGADRRKSRLPPPV